MLRSALLMLAATLAAAADTVILADARLAVPGEADGVAVAALLPGAVVVDAPRLAAAVDETTRLLVTANSAYGLEAWPSIEAHLRRGGAWLHLAGDPLGRAISAIPDGPDAQDLQRSAARRLLFLQSHRIPCDQAQLLTNGAALPIEGWRIRTVQALELRSSIQGGFGGFQGRRIRSVHGRVLAQRDGLPIAAPVLLLDHPEGPWAGGRWILCTADAAPPPAVIVALAAEARQAPSRDELTVELACVAPHESAVLRSRGAAPGQVRVTRDGHLHHAQPVAAGFQRIELPKLPVAGIYRVERLGDDGSLRSSGFVVGDPTGPKGGAPLTVADGRLLRGGTAFAVRGTTYFSATAHRRYLVEPAVDEWDRDLARMAADGVNLIRHGLWCHWDEHCDSQSRPREEVLRALAAWLHVARRHGIAIIFTPFTFVPPDFVGDKSNPWIADSQRAAQLRFVTGFTTRFAACSDLAWDLINEPSTLHPQRLWTARPHGDASEQDAWRRFLASEPADAWRARWGLPGGAALDLPTEADFGDGHRFGDAAPLRAADWRRFAQERFTAWAAALRDGIRASGAAQPIMVGQDEGGLGGRPDPLHHGTVMDLTCTHPWWQNGDQLTQILACQRPDRPSLVQETGMMRYERLDRSSLRTPVADAELLERKLVAAQAGNSAGFVQWCWLTNDLMADDNEAGIGLWRPDGSAKPEYRLFRDLCRSSASAPDLGRLRPADIAILIPRRGLDRPRGPNLETLFTAVRSLAACSDSLRLVPEHDPNLWGDPRLLFVPAPRWLDDATWRALQARAAAGSVVAISGCHADDSSSDASTRHPSRALAGGETALLDGQVWQIAIPGRLRERLDTGFLPADPLRDRSGLPPGTHTVDSRSVGRGRMLWLPLPVEQLGHDDAVRAWYREALRAAGLIPVPTRPAGLTLHSDHGEHGSRHLLINDSPSPQSLQLLRHAGPWADDAGILPPGRAAIIWTDRSGKHVAAYLPKPIDG
jgi:hypothetical protein